MPAVVLDHDDWLLLYQLRELHEEGVDEHDVSHLTIVEFRRTWGTLVDSGYVSAGFDEDSKPVAVAMTRRGEALCGKRGEPS